MVEFEIHFNNDSFSRVVLDGREYYLRTTYNTQHDFWTFGVWSSFDELLYAVKLVPGIPLNKYVYAENAPKGLFYCFCAEKQVTRRAVRDKAAYMVYVSPGEDLPEV